MTNMYGKGFIIVALCFSYVEYFSFISK